jgi:hypothetical protein
MCDEYVDKMSNLFLLCMLLNDMTVFLKHCLFNLHFNFPHICFSQAYWLVKSLINNESEMLMYAKRTSFSPLECPNFDKVYFLYNMHIIFSNPQI